MENSTLKKIRDGSISVDLDTNDVEQVNKNLKQMINISQTIASCLKEGTDFGPLPNVKQLVLYQSGADKILLLFGLRAKYKLVEKVAIDNGYEVVVECELVKINDANHSVYNSFATASNKEAKGRIWPLDTLIKMAQKRAKVWATKSIGGLSDMFIDEEGEDAIRKAHLITTKQFNDIYKALMNVLLKQGHTLEVIKNTMLKPKMLEIISKWNKENTIPIGTLMDLPKTEYDNFIKFIGEK